MKRNKTMKNKTKILGIIIAAAILIPAFATGASIKDTLKKLADKSKSAAPVKVTGVSLNKTSLSLSVGASETLTAAPAPSDAENKAVTWKSSATGVATVDANGKITAVKAGTATITVTTADGGKTAVCSVNVAAPVKVTGVKLNKTALSLAAGANETLAATVAPSNAANQAVTWKSSAATIATVDADGKITAVKAGKATVTVTTADGAKAATVAVTVTAAAAGGGIPDGVYRSKTSGWNDMYIFSGNKYSSGSYSPYYENNLELTNSGTYTAQNGIFTITFVIPGERMDHEVVRKYPYTLAGNTLTITDEDGKKIVYTKQ